MWKCEFGELEEAVLPFRRLETEVLVGELGRDSPPRSAVEESDLHEKRFVDFLDGVGFFGECGGQGVHADRSALILLDDGHQQTAIDLIEAVLIDLQHLKGCLSRRAIDVSGAADLSVIADAAEKAVGDARCSSTTSGDLESSIVVDADVENLRGAVEDDLEILVRVELEAKDESETGAQRRRE